MSLAPPVGAPAFDALADGYDATFTDTHLGRLVRAAVWARLDARFVAGDRVLELNCGTGADACHLAERGVHVVATDIAPAMVAATTRRSTAAGVADRVHTRVLDLDRLDTFDGDTFDGPEFDGIVSDFGGLNCVADLPATLAAMARLLRPGGVAVLGVMGPVVPWEWAWQLRRGKPAAAIRRLRPGGARWRGLTIRYPTPRALRRAAGPRFTVERVTGVGVLLPPTDAQPWADRHPRLLDRLAAAERRLDRVPAAAWLADHYVIELRRTADEPDPPTLPAAAAQATWLARCPDCDGALGPLPPPVEGVATLACPGCGATHGAADGVWRFVPAHERARVDGFLADYTKVRRAEGRGSLDPAYYRALPDTAADDPLAWQWSMRARTWRSLERHEVASWAPGSKVLDLGAGVGWLAHRLHALGHHPVAVDVSVDDLDGLIAARHYPGNWPRVQAVFDRLPFADGEADVVLFNASLHYSVDYHVTLAEARRVLRPGGRIVVLDSPVYRHEHSGRRMVAERHADFERRFGTRSDSVPSIEYLTRARLAELAGALGLRWRTHRTWYGWRWAARPYIARVKRRREPSRFVLLVGTVVADRAGR